MKIALCLYGILGGAGGRGGDGEVLHPKNAFEWYKKHLLDHYDVDVFIHTWSKEHEDLIKSTYNPKSMLAEPQEMFEGVDYKNYGFNNLEDIIKDEGNKIVYDSRKELGENDEQIIEYFNKLIFRTNSRFLSTKKSINLKKKYEEKNNFKYDFVISSRFDLILLNKINFNNLDSNTFYANYREVRVDIDKAFFDLLFYGDSEIMDKFGDLYDNIFNLDIRPPWACRSHIENLKINHKPYTKNWALLREAFQLVKYQIPKLKIIKPGAGIQDMIEVLKKDGVFIVENYIQGDMLKQFHDEILNLCEEKGGHYEFGRNLRGPNLEGFPPDSITRQVYDSDWMRYLYSHYTGQNQGYCSAIYATYDYKSNEGLARNGWLHFDRSNCLKFFIYLTDIDKTNGAFSCSPGSRSKGKELREKAWASKNYENVKNRIELDYKELISEFPSIPVEAKAGTLIVFDTDCFHKGGLCEEGKSRLVVRAHCK